MNINVNVHAESFDPLDNDRSEYDTIPSADALGLSGTFTFKYSYPLSTPAKFDHELTSEMSALDVLVLARKDYEAIYAAEEDPGHIPGMLNRKRSQGPYGIWGHDFGDLYFEGINIRGNNVSFAMGS